MATNITDSTVEIVQNLTRSAFNTNATLDRCKTILNTSLAFPITGNLVHMLAHKYSLEIGDRVGDLIEAYNEPVNYGDIPKHIEDYLSVQDVMDKVFEVVIAYQNELNDSVRAIYENTDIHVFEELMKIISMHNKYVEQVIQWKDIVDRYGNNPSLDVHMKDYVIE